MTSAIAAAWLAGCITRGVYAGMQQQKAVKKSAGERPAGAAPARL
jgi:hypothetical protein